MARNVVFLSGNTPREDTETAAVDLNPGMLLGVEGTPHPGGAVPVEPRFVREQREGFRSGFGVFDDEGNREVIPAGDTITVVYPGVGDIVNAIASEALTDGQFVIAAAGGQVAGTAAATAFGRVRFGSVLPAAAGDPVEIVIVRGG